MIVCVGIPVHDGKPYAQLVDSLLAEQLLGLKQGVHLLPLWLPGVALINIARNRLAKHFLEIKEAPCVVFVDSDISWKAGDLIRLAMRPEPVIGATYRAKTDVEKYHLRAPVEKVGELYRVGGLPGGFIKIAREAFEQIDAREYEDESGARWKDYFPVGIHENVMYGEDYGFCRLWRQRGDVWLDPSIELRHHGGNATYTGSPAKWIEQLRA